MAFDAFLKIEGIDGESTEAEHQNWIDVVSFSWGVSQPSTVLQGSGGATERATATDFAIGKKIDKASPKLFAACVQGTHIGSAIIQFVRRDQGLARSEFIEYKLSDVIVSSLQPAGNSQGDILPTEALSLNFVKIEWSYQPVAGDLVSAIWDRRANKLG